MNARLLLCLMLCCSLSAIAQNSDNQFREPLKEVLAEVQKRYGITLRYPEELVKDRWVTYAGWRFKPDAEKTLSNILAPQDISFTKEGDKKYKLQHYQYHLKSVEEGREQIQYLSGLYNDLSGWEKRKASLKECFLSALRLSEIPARPSSKPIVTAVRKMNGYTIQNIAIETLPGLYVSGSLYLPAKPKGRMPLILNPDGHFAKGRYREDCQYRCATLARMGAIAFSYDLFGWDGESRLQVKPEDHRRSLAQSIQVLNSIRILDMLLSRTDVDTNRVAITGASGGGSQTMLLTAIDNRIKLSVPVVMLSSYHSGGCPCESGLGIHLCEGGTNNAEIASMAAPRPMLVVSDGKDWTKHVPEIEFPFVQKNYSYYNAGAQLKNIHLADEGHDYGFSKRKAMYEFVADKFNLDLKRVMDETGNIDEKKVTIEPETAMFVFGEKGEQLPSNALRNFEAISKSFESSFPAQSTTQRYKVAVVDLMILKRQKLGAFQLTKEIGADGVEVDMGGLGNRPTFDNNLLIDSIRRQFMEKARELDLEIPSLAMTGYYAQSFCQRP
ncbi:MAG TPA: acetylxylan esterase, partial [Chitinophagaceae bacterium]